ncbi:hypothetical protein BJ994_003546 [Arthrobacter pigmenti]|uniref:Uncharacterized protein n=1 Tax=Arthrobacter pigmenti TaxID=271432 RepID=A0A846RSF5_9MICC|nr:hypothetical protein [Arthrobacter pigmenti]NJC24462.1 hypothetical protein [Arthrobacter pigmenti]NJC24470.1 hypothetical protein [Arthrobacter pigmenti]
MTAPGILAKRKTPSLSLNVTPEAPTIENALVDGAFMNWHAGTPVTVGTGLQGNVCGLWRVVAHGADSVIASRHSVETGGILLTIDYQASPTLEVVYLRQLIPNILQFSGGTYTFTADIETDVEIGCDVYAQARYNVNDTNRVLVIDSDQSTLSVGRQRISVPFFVPVLNEDLYPIDFRNSLEFAVRFFGASNLQANVLVRDAIITPGTAIYGPYLEDQYEQLDRLAPYFESGNFQTGGLSESSGQKRFAVRYRTPKWRTFSAANIQVFDQAGTAGKISTYNAAGVRTDGVAYTVIGENYAGDDFRDGFTVVANGSTAAGASFRWTSTGF